YKAIVSFKGAARRLEKLGENNNCVIFKDFAHSPSKLSATIEAVKEQYPKRKLIACMELHTFSSLNKNFLDEYAFKMEKADIGVVFIDEKTLNQKGMEAFSEGDVKEYFKNDNIQFFNKPEKIKEYLLAL